MSEENGSVNPKSNRYLPLKVFGAVVVVSIIIVLLWNLLRKPTVLEVDYGIVEINLTLGELSQATKAYIKERRWSSVTDDSQAAGQQDAAFKKMHRAKTANGDDIVFELRARRSGPQGNTPTLPTAVYITKNGDSGQLELARGFAAYIENQFGPKL
jgi:hypothetical protein